ncbi:MAG TPA: nucleoside-diphosphate sugar epimerase/dehydratase, partial [Geobacteraceae bacterium]
VAKADMEASNIGVVASLFTGLFWIATRIIRKTWFDARLRAVMPINGKVRPGRRTLLVGAGHAGALVAQEMVSHPELGYDIVGFLDDSPETLGASVNGFRVLGRCSEIGTVAAKHRITHAVLAMPTAPGAIIRKIVNECHQLQVEVKTVPGLFDLLGAREWKPDIQAIRIEDLLRREPIHLDQEAMSAVVNGRVVLITGAGGSIGSELARQLAILRPRHMVLLGRGENSLWQIQRNMQALFPAQSLSLELVDIRNRSALREVFERYRPEIVLHTAAHKHVPFLELYPREAVDNNIFGTFNVMEAARDFGARHVVNISTDKAVNPTNVLGASKRVAECIVLNMARKADRATRFVTVRFGNVLGSRGSVVPIFREQIEQGGPVTVTHEAMTRYFMTIPEASQLVLQAALFGETGKIYVLNMGEPVRILDLAADMVKLSGLTPEKDIKIEIVGLRPGEKLHEELFMDEERSSSHIHPKLLEANPRPIPQDVLDRYLESFNRATGLPYEERQPEIVRLFQELVPTYKPSLLGVGKYGGHVKDRRHQDA